MFLLEFIFELFSLGFITCVALINHLCSRAFLISQLRVNVTLKARPTRAGVCIKLIHAAGTVLARSAVRILLGVPVADMHLIWYFHVHTSTSSTRPHGKNT